MYRETQRSGRKGRCFAGTPCLLAVSATIALAGCAAPPKVTVSPQDTLAGRRLFDTEQAFLYASAEQAAGEVASELATVTRDYQKATGHPACGKGLIIVTDLHDLPYAPRQRMVESIQRHESMRTFGTALPLSEDLQRKADQKFGRDVFDKLLLSRCASPTVAEAVSRWQLRGRPAGAAGWVLMVPTRELMLDVTHDLARVKMADLGVPAAQVKPMLALLDLKTRGQATVDRQVGMYCALLWQDVALDPAGHKAIFQRYQQRRGQAALSQMGVPGLPTTQPAGGASATSTPTTRSEP
jgi:hypothetical protein